MLDVKKIFNQWRVIYRKTGALATQTVFESEADAWAYIDKFEDMRGQF